MWATDSLLEVLPDVRRVVIDNAGHLLWVEQPAATADKIRRFLTTATGVPAPS